MTNINNISHYSHLRGGNMAPKSLTDQEIANKRKFILKKGMELILTYGIKKVSVDDIIKAADIAKGTFYLYFNSKEDFFIKLLIDFYHDCTETIERMILEENSKDLKKNLKIFFIKLLKLPEFKFFFTNHKDLGEYMSLLKHDEYAEVKDFEHHAFERLLILANIDISIVKPGIVHNYLHSIYLMSFDEIMIKEYISETFDIMMDGLIEYIFGGLKNESL